MGSGNRDKGKGKREKGLELDSGKMIYHPVGYRGKNDTLLRLVANKQISYRWKLSSVIQIPSKEQEMVMRWILTSVLMVVFFTTPLSAQELTGTLQQIKKSGIIKIGYRESLPPMSFVEKDRPVGYSIDLCDQIANEVESVIGSDVTTKYVPVTAEERFAALSDNRIDILCGATTKTISRR